MHKIIHLSISFLFTDDQKAVKHAVYMGTNPEINLLKIKRINYNKFEHRMTKAPKNLVQSLQQANIH